MQSVKNVLAVNMVVAAALAGEANTKSGLIELDLHMKSKNSANPTLALYTEEGHPDYLDMELMDFMDIQIYSTLYFGSEREPHQVIFDTGSQWLWVQTDLCDNCMTDNNWSFQKSTTFKPAAPYNEFQMHYGSGGVTVFEGADDVCLDAEGTTCAFTKFGNALTQTGLGGMKSDGIVGLAPATFSRNGADLLIPTLQKQGAIENALYSFVIRTQEEQSRITIGGYDTEKFGKADSEFTWHKITRPETSHWMLDFSNMKVGDVELDTVLDRVLMDSGTSLSLFPNKTYYQVLDQIKEAVGGDIEYVENAWKLSTFKCTEDSFKKIPDISFQIDGRELTMPAASYVGFKNNKCTLKFMHNWNDPTMLTLGLNFFENYYTVFDIANSQIGLVESIYSKNESNKEESLSWAKASLTLMQQTADKASEYKEGLIVMGTFAAVAAAFAIGAKYNQSKQQKEQNYSTLKGGFNFA